MASTIDPPALHSPNYYPAPDLLRPYVAEFPAAKDAALHLGLARSELSTYLAWRQRPSAAKRGQIAERSGGRIPPDAWVTRGEREAAAQATAETSTPPAS